MVPQYDTHMPAVHFDKGLCQFFRQRHVARSHSLPNTLAVLRFTLFLLLQKCKHLLARELQSTCCCHLI